MQPSTRNILIGLGAAVVAVYVGMGLAQEQYLTALLAAGASFWLMATWRRLVWTESLILSFLLFAYVLGNRGFAQVMPIPNLPLFFGELGLTLGLALVGLRFAQRRELPLRHDAFDHLLLFLLVAGLARIPFDFRSYGFVALRDFATLYYVLFYFIAKATCRNESSTELLQRTLRLTFSLLPLLSVATYLFPEFFLRHFTAKGIPLILYKGDLQATFLLTGFIVLYPEAGLRARDRWWRWSSALGSLIFGLLLLSRSSLVGLLVAGGWLALAGRWRPYRLLAATIATGLLFIGLQLFVLQKDVTQTKAYAFYEIVVSIADMRGDRIYRSEFSGDKGDNNQFRLVWWKNVIYETFSTSPFVGLGFGTDIARGFLQEYYPSGETDFTARSPHNIFITLLGRMGLLGVAILLIIYARLARDTLRLARQVRSQPGNLEGIRLHAASWVVMISSCFGVVLEGPMGAIPLWIMLGLARHLAGATDR